MPELWQEGQLAYQAFWDLHPERPQHMSGLGFIPREAIVKYAEGLDVDVDIMVRDVRCMDAAYLQDAEERRKAREEQRKREIEREKLHGGRRQRQ